MFTHPRMVRDGNTLEVHLWPPNLLGTYFFLHRIWILALLKSTNNKIGAEQSLLLKIQSAILAVEWQ